MGVTAADVAARMRAAPDVVADLAVREECQRKAGALQVGDDVLDGVIRMLVMLTGVTADELEAEVKRAVPDNHNPYRVDVLLGVADLRALRPTLVRLAGARIRLQSAGVRVAYPEAPGSSSAAA